MLIETVRGWQYNAMGYTLKTVESIFSLAEPDALTTFRDSGDGWTALEVLGHLRDFEGVIFERMRLTVEQDNPPLPFPDPDELARERSYNTQPWRTLLAEWQAERAAHLAFLQARSESDWERPAMHPKRGRLTLLDQLFLTTQHDSLHIEQITRTLAERRTGCERSRMNMPLSFEDFLAHTRAARFDDYAQRPDSRVADAETFRAMQQHILQRYAGLKAVRSLFVDNDVFDCIIEMEVQSPAPTDEGCPQGSIPMRRITLEELTRFQTLGDFLGKSGGSYPR